MYSFLSRYGQLIALGVGAFITIVFFAIIGTQGSVFTDLDSQQLRLVEYNAKLSEYGMFNFGLVATLLLIAITALAVAVFGVKNIVTDFKNSKKGLIGFGVLLVVFIISWFIANSMGDAQGVIEVIEKMNKKGAEITPSISGFISASLISTIFLGVIATLGLVASEVWNLFR